MTCIACNKCTHWKSEKGFTAKLYKLWSQISILHLSTGEITWCTLRGGSITFWILQTNKIWTHCVSKHSNLSFSLLGRSVYVLRSFASFCVSCCVLLHGRLAKHRKWGDLGDAICWWWFSACSKRLCTIQCSIYQKCQSSMQATVFSKHEYARCISNWCMIAMQQHSRRAPSSVHCIRYQH